MPSDVDCDRAISLIEEFYTMRCNGQWEHYGGVTIQSTDNPGWLVTLQDLRLNQQALADHLGPLLREHSAQVATDGTMVRVFAPSLRHCICAAATVITLAE